jgi:hypothetical protein
MNANDITFGIEIETTIPADSAIRVGPHGAGYDIPELPGWKADSDPSIRRTAGRRPCEFVSPVFKGVDGLRQLVADIRKIKSMGATVNASCGLHIHVGYNRQDASAMERIASLVSNFERAIFAATGTKNRERGRWCRGLSHYGSADHAIRSASLNRYHVLNPATRKPTVEFRAFAGSLNEQKIVAYVRMCVGLAERALTAKRTTKWTAKPVAPTSPIHRSGEGQTALTRLFYQLGWTKGRQPHTHGDLSAADLPSLARTKKTLMQMARKYDARP